MTSPRASPAFVGFRFPRKVIAVAVRWYAQHVLSCRYVEGLLAERGITADLGSVPKTSATWPDALLAAGCSATRRAHARPVQAGQSAG